jgi:hypothetical protein
MRHLSLTFGVLPSREKFNECWDKTMDGKSTFQFGNDERVGNDALTQDELWDELGRAVSDMGDENSTEGFVEDSGQWASAVLSVLGIEWV